MKSQALAYFTDIEYTIAALGIFLTVFAGVVAWAFRKSGREVYEKMGRLPLAEETSHE